jgi:hypothetical protein
MRRGTTPTLSLMIDDVDFSLIEKAELTIRQGEKNVLIKNMKIYVEQTVLQVKLNQAETLSLKDGECQLQIKVLFRDGSVAATDIQTLYIQDILHGEVIS